ncbi:hypothetical protein [Orenia marismortui]|uniref:Uncharacterized protein n=1 Tax=Orenia marismortui TaxID=46469 RepID=A0A4R8H1A3_9FIRM|nr:hypothetical protein [Orenia marismortui]TDX48309.1 hypothetical protein C7959_13036 [Orenia marismortui]
MCRYIEKNLFDNQMEHVISGTIEDNHVEKIAELFEIEEKINFIERVNDEAGVILILKTGLENSRRIPVRRISSEYYHLKSLRNRVIEDKDKLSEILEATKKAQEAMKAGMTEHQAIKYYLYPLKEVV